MNETIVMIHGMWGGGWYWENFKKFFEGEGYHCITPTLRFHDVDPKEPSNLGLGTTSLLDYAGDLEKEINKLETVPILTGQVTFDSSTLAAPLESRNQNPISHAARADS